MHLKGFYNRNGEAQYKNVLKGDYDKNSLKNGFLNNGYATVIC